MSASCTEGVSAAEIQVVLNAGLASLRDWLEPRLKHQEELLKRLTEACELGGGPKCADGVPFKEVSRANTITVATAQACKAGGGSGGGNADAFIDEADSVAMPVAKAHYQPLQSKPQLIDADSEGKSRPLELGLENNVDIFPPGQVFSLPLPQEPAPSAWQEPEKSANANKDGCTTAIPKEMSEESQQEWQIKMMDVFDQLDVDMSGNIDRQELLDACHEVGFPPLQSIDLFKQIDKSKNAVIDRMEWLQLVVEARNDDGSNADMELLIDFVSRLAARQESAGRIFQSGSQRRRPFLILRHDNKLRTAWDVTMMLLLFWIAVAMPFSMGFGTNDFLTTFDNASNMLFCFDVILNFRTSYSDQEGQVIFDGWKIAGNYLRSWFLLDFVSSFPFDLITEGILPNMAPARLLKIGKIAKVLKLLRMTKMKRMSEITEQIEDKSTPKFLSSVWRIARLIIITFVMCHWLACFMAAVDMGGLDSYLSGLNMEDTVFSKYLAALYWAMTTLTTVGYGDITPKSDLGRAYYMISMVVGGAFYGYMIQSVASVMTDDLNQRAYLERMCLVTSWLESREKDLPMALRRRIRKHCKEAFSARSAIDDATVIADLSPELQGDTAFFVIDEKVRTNPMFVKLPNSGLASLVPILKKVLIAGGSHVVSDGDPGVAMYILVDGRGRFDSGFMWCPPGSNREQKRFQQLNVGDSFGEEIIFGLEEKYTYTIVSISASTFFTISEDGFNDQFRNLPDLQELMNRSFHKSRSGNPGDFEEEEGEHPSLRLLQFKYMDQASRRF